MMRHSRWLFSLAAVAALHAAVRADDKPDAPKPDEKKSADPKDVRVGPPPELAELRKAVEDAARKGENVDEIRKQLEALEKALAGKAWVKPKPVEDAPPRPGPREEFPVPAPLPGFDPRMPENLLKAQELMLKAALLRAEDPAQAEKLMKQARELLGANPGRFLLPPQIDMRPPPLPGRGSRLGVRVEKVPDAMIERFNLPEDNGVLAAEIVADSPAEKAGLQVNDVLVQFAGKPVGDDPTAFVRTVLAMKPGDKVDIVFYRKGKKQELKGVQLVDLDDRRRDPNPRPMPLPPLVPLVPLPVPPLQLEPNPIPPPPLRVDPNPRPMPIEPVEPRGAERGKAKAVTVRIQNDQFTLHAEEDGVKVVIAGSVGDGKPVPTKITVTEGRKSVDAESVEKLPAEYRDRVAKLLEDFKAAPGK